MGDTFHARPFTAALGYVSRVNIWRLKGAWRAVGQDATLQEGIEPVLDELWQVGASSVLSLRDEGRGVLLLQAVQRSAPGGGARSGRGAIRRPGGAAGRWLAREAPEPGEPARSQAVLHATIALRVACRCVPSSTGPPPSASLWPDRRLQGDKFEGAEVSSGSSGGLRITGWTSAKRSASVGRILSEARSFRSPGFGA